MPLRFLTAGESHGPGLTVIVEGLPAGLAVDPEEIRVQLRRRQQGYGRGGRMQIEDDRAELRGGVRHGETLGGPVALWIENRDFASHRESMRPDPGPPADPRPVTRPRPGHADLAGARKLGLDDARPVLERASARETAARVAAGTLARLLLRELEVELASHTVALGPVSLDPGETIPFAAVAALAGDAELRCARPELAQAMRAAIDHARAAGDTLGGVFEVIAHTPPVGLGHFAHWDRRIDGRIGQAMLSIPAAKAVELGLGQAAAALPGSAVHDPIVRDGDGRLYRASNRAGGIEGGMTNGEELRVRVAMKPLSTLVRALPSVDLRTGEAGKAAVERSDVTVVPAAGVVGEAMLALVLADAALEKFGGDSLGELKRNHAAYLASLEDGAGRKGPGRPAGRPGA